MNSPRIKDQTQWGQELEAETNYNGYDNIRYPAKASLQINQDGSFWVSSWSYLNPNVNEWVDIEEREWEHKDIEFEFDVKIT